MKELSAQLFECSVSSAQLSIANTMAYLTLKCASRGTKVTWFNSKVGLRAFLYLMSVCVCPPTVQQRACFDRMETLHCHTSAYKAGELMDG